MSASGTQPLGLQTERTMLAWRRTGLALVVAALVVSRLTLDVAAPLLVVGTSAVVVATWVALATVRRSRWAVPSWSEPKFELMLRDGRLPMAIAAVSGVLCTVALGLALGLGPGGA